MSYYSKDYYNGSWLTVIIAIVLVFAIFLCVNSCSARAWNNGICEKCETRYELRGVSDGLKYYACPECGQEVRRY